MIKFAMPWPIRPQANPTDPYRIPWKENVCISYNLQNEKKNGKHILKSS